MYPNIFYAMLVCFMYWNVMLYYVCNVMSINVKTKCYVSTDVYFWYSCSSWYHVGLFFFVASDNVWRVKSDHVRPRGTYTNSFGGFMCAHVGCVWGSTTYPTLLIIRKSPRPCDGFKKGPNHVICVIALLTPTVGDLLSIS